MNESKRFEDMRRAALGDEEVVAKAQKEDMENAAPGSFVLSKRVKKDMGSAFSRKIGRYQESEERLEGEQAKHSGQLGPDAKS